MTNLYVPRLRARALSAAVGSGKTRAAINWLASSSSATRNVLYVAPTRALINQTAADLRAAIGKAEGEHIRNVNLIHAGEVARGQVQAEALSSVNGADDNEGCVHLLTTQTFLAILSGIRRPGAWTVVLDEAFQPATFETIRLGFDALGSWASFQELFAVDPADGHRILSREGRRGMVDEVGREDFSSAGDRFKYLSTVARSVANPAIRCELVLTDGTEDLLQGRAPRRRAKAADDKERGHRLEVASYVDPQAFSGFRDVLFLSALFEQTILYHLWTKALGATFEEHPDFPSHLLRDTHREQGRFLAVGHLLHKDDKASLENLSRDILTGLPAPEQTRGRVIDHIVQAATDHFGGEPFLLQTNQRFGYEPGAAQVPRPAVVIPAVAHGLNTFQGVDNVAAFAVTNPRPQQLEWLKARTGLDARAITQAFRIHVQYQALGRCSIRKAEPTDAPKVVLVVGSEDAQFLHSQFPGSHWLGQVGTLPKLSELRQGSETKEPGKAEALSDVIRSHLQTIPETVNRIGSKTLKAAVEAVLRHQGHLRATGADGEVAIPTTTWARALSLACALGAGWQKQGQSVHRLTAAHYGFTAEA